MIGMVGLLGNGLFLNGAVVRVGGVVGGVVGKVRMGEEWR